jgi:carboxy-cis,cis-muconate cyclase
MPVHHLMVGTWTPPGAIFTFAFDTDSLSLTLLKRTEIPKDEPISWMTFSVSFQPFFMIFSTTHKA